uniref:Uncharacterized protein n=1 Tax=Oryza nivara TaxID=4536 RepID=A0A0E0HP61_ORYNI
MARWPPATAQGSQAVVRRPLTAMWCSQATGGEEVASGGTWGGAGAACAGTVVAGASEEVTGSGVIVPADGLEHNEGEHEHEGMDSSWIPDGAVTFFFSHIDDVFINRMDPSSTYLLDVRIMGKTCRPEFPGGFSFKWPIDVDVTNFKDFDSNEGGTSQASKSDAYLENPFPHYEHSDDSSSESDDSIARTDNVPEVEGGDDMSITDSDDEEKLKRKSKPKSTSAATIATENIDPTAMSSQILASLSSSMAIVPLQQVAAPVAKGKGKEKEKEKGKGKVKGKGKGKKDEKEDKDKKIKRKPSPTVQATTPPAKRRKNNEVPQDSPAMRTRNKKSSPAMGTRSKRRIIDLSFLLSHVLFELICIKHAKYSCIGL